MIRRIRPRDAEFYALVCRLAEEPPSRVAEDAPAESPDTARTGHEAARRLQLPLSSSTV